MSKTFDLIIRGGTIFDGSGESAFEGDVAISGNRIAQIGRVAETGSEEIDAVGMAVTPGFVDVHTHYDGQVTWEHTLSPSSGHGVSTVVMGNCGVGFAPCRPAERDMLVRLMEGVEDIPEVVMTAGIPWNWETFPDYLDALDRRSFDIDVAAQLPHSPLRVYVMGERGANREPPTEDDLERMQALTAEAIRAGAIGVSTSRSLGHRSKDGSLAPSTTTEESELAALARGLRDAGGGVFQLLTNNESDPAPEAALMRRLMEVSGRPLSFTLLQTSWMPEAWRTLLSGVEAANAAGLPMRGQVFPRPIGVLFGLDLSLHPFALHPSFQPLSALPLKEKVAALRDPEMRRRLLSEKPVHANPLVQAQAQRLDRMFRFGDPPCYEPDPSDSIAAQAERRGISAYELAYELLLEQDGTALFYNPATNYVDNNLNVARRLMTHPSTIVALGDGGAHYGLICDASYPTYVLTRWMRDAAGDEKWDMASAVHALAAKPAAAMGFNDRGTIRLGRKADINVIDLDRLRLHAPRPVYDLPAGGRRLRQQADGYVANIVSGVITYRDGEPTGSLPGRLVRGAVAQG
ncbi:MAG TPA: amidohydrolase family protein [Stellaceae bacterium]|nr:amidohydrolase family protein [Stellaceae bacterium]